MESNLTIQSTGPAQKAAQVGDFKRYSAHILSLLPPHIEINAMPIVKIEVCRTHPPEQVSALIDAVYQAQLIALKLPEDDKQIRYVEHKPEHFPIPPGKTENYTLVEYQLFPGRSLEAKRNLYKNIVQRFGELGIEPSDIIIVLHEPPLENWGIRGLPASEIKLGVNLNV